MKKQLLIAMAVFTVGFAVGYGITWLLVSGGSPDDGGARAEVKSGLATEGGAEGGGTATAGVAKPDPPATKPSASASKPDEDDGAIGTAPVKPKPASVPEAKEDAGAASPDAADETPPAADAGPSVPDEEGGDEVVGDDSDKATTWWDRCVGKRCKVNWGAVRGGISLRKGSIKHGSRVDWKLRFGSAPRVDTVKAGGKTIFEVRGVGLGMDGLPTCAEVEYKKGGSTVTGIIALKLGSKRITMEPVTP